MTIKEFGSQIAEYEEVARCPGFMEDVYKAQDAYHESGRRPPASGCWKPGTDFPRYYKPLKFEEKFYTATDDDAERQHVVGGYSDWTVATVLSCKGCKTSVGERKCRQCLSKQKAECWSCGCAESDALCRLCVQDPA